MHVRDLLDLQGTLETRRVLEAATHDEQRTLVREQTVRKFLQSLVSVEHLLDLTWQLVQTVNDLAATLNHRDAVLRELDGEHDERNVLTRVRLGARNTDFRASVDMHTTVRLARQRGTDRVDDTNAKRAALKAVAQRQNRVGRLATLADEDAGVVAEDGRLAIEEVACEFDADGNLGQLFEDGACRERRVVARAARAEDNAATAADNGQERPQTTQSDDVRVKVDAATHGVDDGLGLLVDLLLHEVVEATLHDLGKLELQGLDKTRCGLLRLAVGGIAAQTVNGQFAVGNVSDVIVLEEEDTLGVLDDGGRIGCNVEFDRLWATVLAEERATLSAENFASRRCRRGQEATTSRGSRRLEARLGRRVTGKLDIDKVDLELLLRLDTDEKRRAATSGDDLVGEVNRFEHEGKGTLELGENRLDESGEVCTLVWLGVPDVLAENCDSLCVCLALEAEAALLEDEAEFGAVGYDAVVDDDELVRWV